MAYKPTSNPPGKPTEPPEVPDVEALKDMHRAHIPPGTGGLCGLCYPDGWPEGATGLGCQHGSWTRLATGIV